MVPGSPGSPGQHKHPLKTSLQNCRCSKIQCSADVCHVPHPAHNSTDWAGGNRCLGEGSQPLIHTPSMPPPELTPNLSLWFQTEQQLIIKSLLQAQSLFQELSFLQHLCSTAAVQPVLTLRYEYRSYYEIRIFNQKPVPARFICSFSVFLIWSLSLFPSFLPFLSSKQSRCLHWL